MTIKELDRLDLINKILEKRMSQSQGAESLGVSARQIRRLIKNYKK